MDPMQNAGVFLVGTLFNLYIMVVLLRFIFNFMRLPHTNQFIQLILKLTDPVVKPLQRIIPCYRTIDFATLVFAIILSTVKLVLWITIKAQIFPQPLGILVFVFGDILRQALNIYFYGILIQVILSWVSSGQYNPLLDLVTQLTAPIMRPFQKIIPRVAGFDLSPIPAMIVLRLMIIMLIQPLIQVGLQLAV